MTSDPEVLKSAAEKCLKTGFTSFFTGGPKYDEAADFYSKAANIYKLRNQWLDASFCFNRAAEISAKEGDTTQQAHYYVESGNVLKKASTQDAVVQYNKAIDIYNASGRFSSSAKLMKSCAELAEAEGSMGDALLFYKRAADYFELDEYGKSSYSTCIVKYAELVAKHEGKVDTAIDIFEAEGQKALKNTLIQFGAKEYFFKAGILQLTKGDAITASVACEKYCKFDPRFASSREGKLLQELCTAYEASDVEAYVKALGDYDRISGLDTWKIHFLHQVKTSMEGTSGKGKPSRRAAPPELEAEDVVGESGGIDLS